MKTLTRIMILALLAITSCIKRPAEYTGPEIAVGDHIPTFELQTINGKTVSSSTLPKRGAVIIFFNTWCPDCHNTLPVIQHWADKDTTDDTMYLCIARGQSNEEIRAFWRENGYTIDAAGDPDKSIYNSFTGNNGYGVPVVYIIDGAGSCIRRILQTEKLEM